jgi:hypothetical protein
MTARASRAGTLSGCRCRRCSWFGLRAGGTRWSGVWRHCTCNALRPRRARGAAAGVFSVETMPGLYPLRGWCQQERTGTNGLPMVGRHSCWVRQACCGPLRTDLLLRSPLLPAGLPPRLLCLLRDRLLHRPDQFQTFQRVASFDPDFAGIPPLPVPLPVPLASQSHSAICIGGMMPMHFPGNSIGRSPLAQRAPRPLPAAPDRPPSAHTALEDLMY